MTKSRRYLYPVCDPWLEWAGRAELGEALEVETVDLHVHEVCDPAAVLRNMLRDPLPRVSQYRHEGDDSEEVS